MARSVRYGDVLDRLGGRGVPILMYHSISTDRHPALAHMTLDPARFAEHVAWLAEAGWNSFTVSALAEAIRAGRPLAARAVVVTFDDGYLDFLTDALPILEHHGIQATLYVTSAQLTGPVPPRADSRAFLDAAQLLEVADRGVEIGAHSHTHPQLDVLPAADLEREVRLPKTVLEDVLGRPVESFAYPFGYYGAATRAAVAAAGYRSACAVDDVVCRPGADDVLALPRRTVPAGAGVAELRRILAGRRMPLARPAVRAAQAGWRAARRTRVAVAR